ncbi:MAG: DUF1573 domain-containing protein [Acidobacteria bacterium]|nr:DUF1573 domain-containing protein [Acidobacteriota bacterium]
MKVRVMLQPAIMIALAVGIICTGPFAKMSPAQEPAAAEIALKKRVAEFYSLMRVDRTADAERLVTADTLERFRVMPNGEFLNATVDSIEFNPDGKSATVNILLAVSAAAVPVPFQLPRKTNWRLESDGWRIIIPAPMEHSDCAMFRNCAPKPGDLLKLDLQFTQPVVDLTPIKQGEKKIAKFAFTNSSDHSVTIEDVQADCACVTMKTQKKAYKAGEASEIELEFDSTKYAYAFGQTVAIITEPGNQRINLLLKASVTPKN